MRMRAFVLRSRPVMLRSGPELLRSRADVCGPGDLRPGRCPGVLRSGCRCPDVLRSRGCPDLLRSGADLLPVVLLQVALPPFALPQELVQRLRLPQELW